MEIKTAYFGTQSIDPQTIIDFPQGLPGLEHCKRFKLFHEAGDAPVVHWLQGIDDPELVLSVVDPASFGLSYRLELSDADVALLRLASADDAQVLLTLTRETGSDDGAPINANITAPVVINTRERVGIQVPVRATTTG